MHYKYNKKKSERLLLRVFINISMNCAKQGILHCISFETIYYILNEQKEKIDKYMDKH